MPRSPLEADWLQDTLEDVARRLRHDGEDLAWCAEQLEKIVIGLRYPDDAVASSRPNASNIAAETTRSADLPLQITITVASGPQP
jgi:hypothetical protein